MTRSVDCPACGKKVLWSAESPWRPFCSERCKVVDLGDWAAERHVIPGSTNDVTEEGAPDPAAPDPLNPSLRRGH
jgi:uncharacterized protein